MNLFELFFKIGVKDEASGEVNRLSQSLGKGLKTAATVGIAAVTAAAVAASALAKESIENFAEYEQLVGGAKTLFKDSSDTILEYADEAYMTAGASANQYLSTVTGFSASLLQSLEGDTEAAAVLADQALRDMSDNANRMGTDMEALRNTYLSLARGEYRLLDNLRIGYNGTRAELRRMIKDAAELDDSVDASSTSFSNIIKAIHAVQTELGITGTTAKEALTTIQGSANAAKAAWENLTVAMALGNGKEKEAADRFVESLSIAVDNILPRVETILGSAANAVDVIGPKIIEKLPGLVSDLAPPLSKSAASLIVAVFENLPAAVSSVPEIGDIAMTVIANLAAGIAEAVDKGELGKSINAAIVGIFRSLSSGESNASIRIAGVDIVLSLIEGFYDGIPEIVKAAPAIVGNITGSLIAEAPRMSLAGPELVYHIWKGLYSPDNIAALGSGTIEFIFGILNGLKYAGHYLRDGGAALFNNIKEGFMNFKEDPAQWVNDLINRIIDGIKSRFGDVGALWNELWSDFVGKDDDEAVASVGDVSAVDGSHRLGLDRVPYDGYIAELHEGERVLTKGEARRYNVARDGGITVNVNIDGARYSDEESLAEAVADRLQKLFENEDAITA